MLKERICSQYRRMITFAPTLGAELEGGMKKFGNCIEVFLILISGGIVVLSAIMAYSSLVHTSLPRQERLFGVGFLVLTALLAFGAGSGLSRLKMESLASRLRFELSPCKRLAAFKLGGETYLYAVRDNGSESVTGLRFVGLLRNVETGEEIQTTKNRSIMNPIVDLIGRNALIALDFKSLEAHETIGSVLEQLQSPKGNSQLVNS